MNTTLLRTRAVILPDEEHETYGGETMTIHYGALPSSECAAEFHLTGHVDDSPGNITVPASVVSEIEPFFAPLARLVGCDVVTGAPAHVVDRVTSALLSHDSDGIAALLRCDPALVTKIPAPTAETVLQTAGSLVSLQTLQWFNEAATVRQTYGLAVPSPAVEHHTRQILANRHGDGMLTVPAAAKPAGSAMAGAAQSALVDHLASQLNEGASAKQIMATIDEQLSLTEDIDEAMYTFGTEGNYHKLAHDIVNRVAAKFQR